MEEPPSSPLDDNSRGPSPYEVHVPKSPPRAISPPLAETEDASSGTRNNLEEEADYDENVYHTIDDDPEKPPSSSNVDKEEVDSTQDHVYAEIDEETRTDEKQSSAEVNGNEQASPVSDAQVETETVERGVCIDKEETTVYSSLQYNEKTSDVSETKKVNPYDHIGPANGNTVSEASNDQQGVEKQMPQVALAPNAQVKADGSETVESDDRETTPLPSSLQDTETTSNVFSTKKKNPYDHISSANGASSDTVSEVPDNQQNVEKQMPHAASEPNADRETTPTPSTLQSKEETTSDVSSTKKKNPYDHISSTNGAHSDTVSEVPDNQQSVKKQMTHAASAPSVTSLLEPPIVAMRRSASDFENRGSTFQDIQEAPEECSESSPESGTESDTISSEEGSTTDDEEIFKLRECVHQASNSEPFPMSVSPSLDSDTSTHTPPSEKMEKIRQRIAERKKREKEDFVPVMLKGPPPPTPPKPKPKPYREWVLPNLDDQTARRRWRSNSPIISANSSSPRLSPALPLQTSSSLLPVPLPQSVSMNTLQQQDEPSVEYVSSQSIHFPVSHSSSSDEEISPISGGSSPTKNQLSSAGVVPSAPSHGGKKGTKAKSKGMRPKWTENLKASIKQPKKDKRKEKALKEKEKQKNLKKKEKEKILKEKEKEKTPFEKKEKTTLKKEKEKGKEKVNKKSIKSRSLDTTQPKVQVSREPSFINMKRRPLPQLPYIMNDKDMYTGPHSDSEYTTVDVSQSLPAQMFLHDSEHTLASSEDYMNDEFLPPDQRGNSPLADRPPLPLPLPQPQGVHVPDLQSPDYDYPNVGPLSRAPFTTLPTAQGSRPLPKRTQSNTSIESDEYVKMASCANALKLGSNPVDDLDSCMLYRNYPAPMQPPSSETVLSTYPTQTLAYSGQMPTYPGQASPYPVPTSMYPGQMSTHSASAQSATKREFVIPPRNIARNPPPKQIETLLDRMSDSAELSSEPRRTLLDMRPLSPPCLHPLMAPVATAIQPSPKPRRRRKSGEFSEGSPQTLSPQFSSHLSPTYPQNSPSFSSSVTSLKDNTRKGNPAGMLDTNEATFFPQQLQTLPPASPRPKPRKRNTSDEERVSSPATQDTPHFSSSSSLFPHSHSPPLSPSHFLHHQQPPPRQQQPLFSPFVAPSFCRRPETALLTEPDDPAGDYYNVINDPFFSVPSKPRPIPSLSSSIPTLDTMEEVTEKNPRKKGQYLQIIS